MKVHSCFGLSLIYSFISSTSSPATAEIGVRQLFWLENEFKLSGSINLEAYMIWSQTCLPISFSILCFTDSLIFPEQWTVSTEVSTLHVTMQTRSILSSSSLCREKAWLLFSYAEMSVMSPNKFMTVSMISFFFFQYFLQWFTRDRI